MSSPSDQYVVSVDELYAELEEGDEGEEDPEF
jgi:hypothetical protein